MIVGNNIQPLCQKVCQLRNFFETKWLRTICVINFLCVRERAISSA